MDEEQKFLFDVNGYIVLEDVSQPAAAVYAPRCATPPWPLAACVPAVRSRHSLCHSLLRHFKAPPRCLWLQSSYCSTSREMTPRHATCAQVLTPEQVAELKGNAVGVESFGAAGTLQHSDAGVLHWGKAYRDAMDHPRVTPIVAQLCGETFRLDHINVHTHE